MTWRPTKWPVLTFKLVISSGLKYMILGEVLRPCRSTSRLSRNPSLPTSRTQGVVRK